MVQSNGDFKSAAHLRELKRDFARDMGCAAEDLELEIFGVSGSDSDTESDNDGGVPRNTPFNGTGHRLGGGGGSGAADPPVPNEEVVAQIVAMGFERSHALEALRSSGGGAGGAESAIAWLLDQPPREAEAALVTQPATEAAAVEMQTAATQSADGAKTTPHGLPLIASTVSHEASRHCDGCGAVFAAGDTSFSNREEDYDLCTACFSAPATQAEKLEAKLEAEMAPAATQQWIPQATFVAPPPVSEPTPDELRAARLARFG
eukprot:SAG11_NODE_708_length_7648_cov_3.486687_2_plen_262_part_00